MKEISSKAIFVIVDIAVMYLSIGLAYILRDMTEILFQSAHMLPLSLYFSFYPLIIIPIFLFFYEGFYNNRYDFWHESHLILKVLFFSFLIIMTYLAMTKTIQDYSRAVIIFSFIIMALLLPIAKNITKKLLFKIGLWQRRAKVYGNDPFLVAEVFGNHYLGYVECGKHSPRSIFVNPDGSDKEKLQHIINEEIKNRHEVIFIPLMKEFDLTHSHIYELSNTRTNLVVFQNRLKSRYRIWLKQLSDIVMFLIAFPLLLPVMAVIAYKIKREEPDGSILFKQERMGKNDETFICYKFRTMTENGDELLESYLKEHPEEVQAYAKYHKYENDPRITKIGHFLRRTSLDELPQIFNVFKGEMSFVGPRPYMLSEKEKIGDSRETILAVKPGITGLWQVSGRSEVDFMERVYLDAWYIRNWNLWMDNVVLMKTVKTVLLRKGAS